MNKGMEGIRQPLFRLQGLGFRGLGCKVQGWGFRGLGDLGGIRRSRSKGFQAFRGPGSGILENQTTRNWKMKRSVPKP